MEAAGVISGYQAVVDQDVVGLTITAFVRLKLGSHTTDAVEAVESRLREIPEVVEAFVLAGDYDYMLKIVTGSFAAYEALLRDSVREIPGLFSIDTTLPSV